MVCWQRKGRKYLPRAHLGAFNLPVLLRNAFLFRQSLRILPETKDPLLSMQSDRIIMPYNSNWLSSYYMLALNAGTETPNDDHHV